MTKRKRRRKQRIIIGSTVGVILVLAAAYLAMSFYFSSHFFFRTKINGWKVGGMDLKEAEEKVGNSVEDYLLTVFDREGEKYHIYGKDIGCTYVSEGSVHDFLESQNPYQWLVGSFQPSNREVPITMKYEKELLADAVSNMECFQKENITEPESARVELGEDGYYIEPEIMGNHMILENVLAKVEDAVTAGEVTF